jgi:hypothetical protein
VFVAQPLDRQAGLLEVLPELGQPQHRRTDPAGQHVEGDELADAEVAVDHQHGAEIERRRGADLVDELGGLARDVAEVGDLEAGGDVARELLFPAAVHFRLNRHGLERLDAVDRFDQEGLVFGAPRELLIEPAAQHRGHQQRQHDVARDRGEHDPGQHRAVPVHDAQEDDGEDEVDHQGQGGAGQEVAHRFQLAHAGDAVARPAGLEVGQRQRQQVAEQAGAQRHVDAVGGVGEHVCPQGAEHGFEHRDDDQTEDQHVERGQAPVNQHLVDHDLEEQRRDQGEDLEEEGGDQDFREQRAVADDGGDEPADAEPVGVPGQGRAAGQQDQLAAPGLLELVAVDGEGTLFQGVLDQDLVGRHLGQHEETAVAALRYGGQRRAGQPVPGRPHEPGLDAQVLGAAQQLAAAHRLGGAAVLVLQPFRRCRDARETQDKDQ